MTHRSLIAAMRSRRGPEVESLDAYLEQFGFEVFNRLNDVARSSPELVDGAAVEWAVGHADRSPGSVLALLLNLSAKDPDRRAELRGPCRTLLAAHPAEGLRCAGYNLHEHHFLLDDEWLAAAHELFDQDPEGAWGIFESASMYEPHLIREEHLASFEARRPSMPRDCFVCLLSLALHRADRAPDLMARVLCAFSDHPSAAVEASAFVARSEAALQTAELVSAVVAHFGSNREKAWEFFEGACRTRPEHFGEKLLDALAGFAETEPGSLFTILRRLMEAGPDGERPLMDRYVGLVLKHPEKGLQSVRYAFQRGDAKLIRPDLVKAVCKGFAAAPYEAYDFLWLCSEDRPELIGAAEVDAALRNIGGATNRAFGFFRDLVKKRPEFTREGTLALFECLAQEPVHRAHVRAEEIESLVAISEAAHVRTGLENALREPPTVGSKRARALMAIMFRQKLRARRHVLLEALRYAAKMVLWRPEPGEKFSPVWDFLFFIIDHSGDDAVSTAAAERFLEGAFQLHYLCRTGAEEDRFLFDLDTGSPPARPFPAGAEFLESDAELSHLYRLAHELGRRFGVEPRIGPLEEFSGRRAAAERELAALEDRVRSSDGTRRRKREERLKTLRFQAACWDDPEYGRAFTDPEAEGALSPEARTLLKREKKDLAKRTRDALRAEAIRIAVAAVERSRMALYRNRLRDALGRDVDLDEVEPKILPAFLWFQAVSRMEKSTRYLRRLVEDRIAKRPHDWLRSEPAALEWADRVRQGQPGVRLDRWRAEFSKEFQYRPKDAQGEKRRRIKADLSQARILLEKAGAKGIASETYADLSSKLTELKAPPVSEEKEGGKKGPPPDPALLAEVEMNLERVRISEQTPDSDFEGRIRLTVETDPFEMLFMGEYGFASCLSLRGSNAWSAVSNAIDVDKAIVWAKEPGGNVVGRRLLALTPAGILVYRTYTNRHGLALDRVFDEFVEAYAAHCGTVLAHSGHPGPLLSDHWYDDGAI